LEWPYRPADFFETPYHCKTDEYTLIADAGIVLVTLSTPSDPIDAGLQNEIAKKVKGLFLARQLLVHRTFKLESVRVYQHGPDGKKSISVTAEGVVFLSAVDQGDIVIRDASGAVVRDSKSERITEHTKFIDSITEKLGSSPTLNALLEHYNRAVSNPTNELAHLYDIRDTLAKHYGTETETRRKLGITQKDWKRLGYLANDAPLSEGRHRGRHSNLRHATAAELDDARRIARQLIAAFANQV